MTRVIANFVHERLEQAMVARGCSAVELAAGLEIAPATLSRLKNGAQAPSGEMIQRLADKLRVSPEWLTRPMPRAATKPCFRGSVAQMKAERGLLNARINWLDEIAQELEQYVDFPKVALPSIPARKLSEITNSDIESAAAACRSMWGLRDGPISDVLLLLENSGVIVAREETGTPRIEGLSAWSASTRPLVLLCADKLNAYRSRFDAAHELGHLVLHKHIEPPADPAGHKQIEQQAHRFAGAFLLPEKSFAAEIAFPVSLQGLTFLKRRWGVSVAAMIMRLVALKLVSESDYLRLIKLRSARWGNKQEPNDDDRQPEEPRLLRRTAAVLEQAGVLTAASLPSVTGLSARDVESLMGLPLNSLSFPKAEVVDLALKRRVDPQHLASAETSGGVLLEFGKRLRPR